MTAQVDVSAGERGRTWFEWRLTDDSGPGAWNETTRRPFCDTNSDGQPDNCPANLSDIPLAEDTPNTLSSGNTYEFRICGYTLAPSDTSGSPLCANRDGKEHAASVDDGPYSAFTTTGGCSHTIDTSYDNFASEVDPILDSNETLCLEPGEYEWGDNVTLDETNVTIRPKQLADANPVIDGEVDITGDDAKIRDIKLVGASGGTTGTIRLASTADGARLSHLEITSDSSSRDNQGVFVAGGSDGVIANSLIHHNGADGDFHHGVYCEGGQSLLIRDSWIYRNAAYGIQLYPNCDGTDIVRTVIASNGECDWDRTPPQTELTTCSAVTDNARELTLANESPQTSTNNAYDGFVVATDKASQSAGEPPFHCVGGADSTNSATNGQIKPVSGTTYTDCSNVAFSDISVGAPGFANVASDNYEANASGTAALLDEMGASAYVNPGPR